MTFPQHRTDRHEPRLNLCVQTHFRSQSLSEVITVSFHGGKNKLQTNYPSPFFGLKMSCNPPPELRGADPHMSRRMRRITALSSGCRADQTTVHSTNTHNPLCLLSAEHQYKGRGERSIHRRLAILFLHNSGTSILRISDLLLKILFLNKENV